jgi:hypothetical protein
MIKRLLIPAVATVALLSSPALAKKKKSDPAQDAAMAQALAALDAQLPGTLVNNPYSVQWSTDGGDNRGSIVEAPGIPGGMAYQVRVKKKKRNAWDIASRFAMEKDIKEGDVILMKYWARAAKPPKGSETGKVMVSIQRNIDPYDDIFIENIEPTTEWREYTATGVAKRDYSADKTNLNYNLAQAKQTLEFGSFYIMNLGPNGDATPYLK